MVKYVCASLHKGFKFNSLSLLKKYLNHHSNLKAQTWFCIVFQLKKRKRISSANAISKYCHTGKYHFLTMCAGQLLVLQFFSPQDLLQSQFHLYRMTIGCNKTLWAILVLLKLVVLVLVVVLILFFFFFIHSICYWRLCCLQMSHRFKKKTVTRIIRWNVWVCWKQ